MEMYDCDKFEGCSAPVCPMWKPIHNQRIIKGEELCIYLLEYQKERFRSEIFEGAYKEEVAREMAKATEEIFARPDIPTYLKNALVRASKTGSRILAGRSLNA